ncbi:MAG: hypothetical protein ACI9MR_000758 [Myxococcota bacterium]|jgi:hypothetical protein
MNVLKIVICTGRDPLVIKAIDGGFGVRQEDRGVSDHDELAPLGEQHVNARQESKLALGREGRFGFVEEEETVVAETVFDKGEERLAVTLVMERLPAIASGGADLVDERRDVEEAFGAPRSSEARWGQFPARSGDGWGWFLGVVWVDRTHRRALCWEGCELCWDGSVERCRRRASAGSCY